MDTSETYIKMRVKAIPDLGVGTPPEELGRWLSESIFIDGKGDFYYTHEGVGYPAIACQLERQDQLQEMVDETRPYFLWMSLDIEANSGLAPDMGWNDYWQSFTSMEQLWLAFVMKEKYNKVWNGEDWSEIPSDSPERLKKQ